MAFFLIGRTPSGELHLLSTDVFEARDDAMAELARLTASPSWDRWDSDVFVMDLNAGVPVLLVRPVPNEPQTSLSAPDENMTAIGQESEPFVGEEPELIEAEMVIETPELEETEVALVEPVAEAVEAQEAPPALEHIEPIEPVRDAAIAEEIVEEAEAPEVAPVLPRADEAVTQEAPESPLGDALAGAAERVSAETATALPAEELEPSSEASAEEETAAPAWPWTRAPEPSVDVAPDIADVYSSLDEIEPETGQSAVAPLPEIAEPTLTGTVNAPMSLAEEAVAVEEVGEESDFILDLDVVQETPAESGDVLVPSAAAEKSPAEPAPAESETETAAAPGMTPEPASSTTAEASAGPVPAPVPAPVEASSTVPEVSVGPAAAPPPTPAGAEEAVPTLQEYTCEDCVYVETCPKRDQVLPKDCGSFQWK